MPVHKCPNGKYRIGSGKCIYDSKEKAERAYKGYLAADKLNEEASIILNEIKKERERIREMLDLLHDYSSYLWNLEYVKKYESGKRGNELYE